MKEADHPLRLRAVPNFIFPLAVLVAFSTQAAPLIVDHTSVLAFTNLTDVDIARAKRLWLSFAGESHATAFPLGCRLLSNAEPRFAVSTVSFNEPDGASTNYLRVNNAVWGDLSHSSEWCFSYGEEDWFTSDLAVVRTKDGIRYCNTNIAGGLHALAFGWCWDMSWQNSVGGGTNTAFWVRWAGSSVGGADGNRRWGLTAGDYSHTGNRVCVDTYLLATEEYRKFCASNGYQTKVIFTTGPADTTGETGYQVWLKNEHIRNYVSNTTNGILFDYADILCWDQNGRHTSTWVDWSNTQRIYPTMADDNMLDLDGVYNRDDGDHIGERGALRLAKALWFMLAKIAEQDAAPPAPVLKVAADTPGIIQIHFLASSNATYTVQTSFSLASNSWQNLLTIPSQPYPQSVFFIDRYGTNSMRGFYRVSARPAL